MLAAVISLITAVMLTRTAIAQLTSSTSFADGHVVTGLDGDAKLVDEIV